MKLERRTDNRHTSGRERATSQSVMRALMVLDLLGECSEELGVREIARRLSLSPSIVQRLVATLAAAGYLEQSQTALKYRIGYRLFHVGRSYLARADLHVVSQPELHALAEREINAFLGVMQDGAIVYLAAIQSRGPIAIMSSPGSRTLLHSTALGKAILASMTDAEIARLLGPEPFARRTARTKTTLAPLLAEIREVRRRGYAISDEENLDNVYAVGAPLRDASGSTIAAISGAVPRNQLRPAAIKDICELVTSAAERISRRLGAEPTPVPLSLTTKSEKANIEC